MTNLALTLAVEQLRAQLVLAGLTTQQKEEILDYIQIVVQLAITDGLTELTRQIEKDIRKKPYKPSEALPKVHLAVLEEIEKAKKE